jgi:hypothetical protein
MITEQDQERAERSAARRAIVVADVVNVMYESGPCDELPVGLYVTVIIQSVKKEEAA